MTELERELPSMVLTEYAKRIVLFEAEGYRPPMITKMLKSEGTVRLEKLFPFCYRCTFLKRCDRLRSVPFYYRSPFRVITVLRFVSLLLAFKRYSLASVFFITCTT